MEVMISSKMVRAITKYTLHALGIISFTMHGNNYNNPDSQRQQNNQLERFRLLTSSVMLIDQANLQQLDDVIITLQNTSCSLVSRLLSLTAAVCI